MENKLYRPSNGTEGDEFTTRFCYQCKNEKQSHTGEVNDLCCDILTRSMIYDLNEPEYPIEWCYDDNGKPACTAHVFHNWINSETGGLNEPEIVINDPNQLKLFEDER